MAKREDAETAMIALWISYAKTTAEIATTRMTVIYLWNLVDYFISSTVMGVHENCWYNFQLNITIVSGIEMWSILLCIQAMFVFK